MLKIHNSLSGKKEEFRPIEPGKVKMYVCGMTVYDYCHLGHARVVVVFDAIVRYLRASAYEVNYVRNITDIDDKIIARANENGESIGELTERFIAAMNEDFTALGVLPPDSEPKATEYIDQITGMIQALIDRGYAYVAKNGDVCYDIGKFEGYGKLSGKNIDELQAGARVDVEDAKDNPLDFVLWKLAKAGEPSWESPWGAGRPGWHIECSAMSTNCLGNHFDIHGGGQDLQFPHHENEIAQSEGATGETFVNIWAHNGFVRVDDEKMSKSLGNFFTVREILEKYRPEEIRYFILSSHYRSQLNYSESHLDEARASLTRLYTALKDVDADGKADESIIERFNEVMDDDFNTPRATALLHEIASEINRQSDKNSEKTRSLASSLKHLAGILGLLQTEPEVFLKSVIGSGSESGLSDSEIEEYIEQRKTAKAEKNYAESDRIRDLLSDAGILLEDTAEGTEWRRS